MTKNQILTALQKFIDQRPGIDPRNYISGWNDSAGRSAYRADSRKVTEQKHTAQTLLNYVERSQITAEELTAAFSAYSGRLTLKDDGTLDYCTGQYFPTEYRAAACAVLAQAIWNYHRPDYANEPKPGEALRKAFRRIFGAKIARQWFE